MAPHATSPTISPAMSPSLSQEPYLVEDEPYYYGTDAPELTQTERYPETGITILIVGAGIGGLTAAMECWRKGHLVRIVERNATPPLTGDVISVGPSVMANLRHYPEMADNIESVHLDAKIRYFGQDGELIYGPDECVWNDPDKKEGRVGPRVAFMQKRGEFYQLLLHQVQKLGIMIEWGNPVKDYFENDKPGKVGKGGVVLENGETRTADVVIAADGIKTRAGPIVRGTEGKPVESGVAMYRTAYDGKFAYEDPTVREKWPVQEDGRPYFDFYMGKGMHVVAAVAKDYVSWALTHKDDGSAREDWDPEVSPEQVLDVMGEGWDESLAALFKTCPPGKIIHWKLMWRDLSETWVSPHGRVVQLGDAVHSFLPSSGNGATQAMEDAITLATCLQLGGKTQIAQSARVYNKLRYERIACAQKLSFTNAVAKQKTNFEEIRKNPSKVRSEVPKWIYQHNPEQYAYQNYGLAYNHLVSGAPFENTNIPPGHTPTPLNLDEALGMVARGEMANLDGDWS